MRAAHGVGHSPPDFSSGRQEAGEIDGAVEVARSAAHIHRHTGAPDQPAPVRLALVTERGLKLARLTGIASPGRRFCPALILDGLD
jgi:hypothetical protein